MTVDVKAGSFATPIVQSASATSGLSSGRISVNADSAQALVKISASNKLSGAEKTGLIKDIAVVDRFANENNNLRKTLLNDVIRNTISLERTQVQALSQPKMPVTQVAKQFVQAREAAPKPSDNVEIQQQVQASLNRRSNSVSVKPPESDVQAAFANVNKRQVQQLQQAIQEFSRANVKQAPQANVQDRVDISSSKSANENVSLTLPGARLEADFVRINSADFEPLPIPGAGSAEFETVSLPGSGEVDFEPIPLPGSSVQEYEAIPLPGSGEVEIPELNLPGSGSVEFEAVTLPGSGEYVEEIPLSLVGDTAALIGESAESALAAYGDIQIPGRVLSGAEALEQQGALRRVLQEV